VEEVQTGDVQQGDTGQVPERLGDAVVLLVDDEGSLPHGVTPVSDFADAGPHLSGLLGFLYIIVSSNSLHQSDSLLGLGEGFNSSFDDTGYLGNLVLVGANMRPLLHMLP